jgi:hypothetical protein
MTSPHGGGDADRRLPARVVARTAAPANVDPWGAGREEG